MKFTERIAKPAVTSKMGFFVARRSRLTAVPLLVLASLLLSPASALASFGDEGFAIESFESSLTTGGLPATQAGSHPDSLEVKFMFKHHEPLDRAGEPGEIPDGNPELIDVNLPPGVAVNPTVTLEKCTEAELLISNCPEGSTVGTATIFTTTFAEIPGQHIYNMVPPPTVSADFGLNVLHLGVIVHILGRVRTGSDYGLTGETPGISQRGGTSAAYVTFKGFPAARPGELGKPFLTLPSACGSPLTSTMTSFSWQGESAGPVASIEQNSEGDPVPVTGCEDLSFDPELKVHPSTSVSDSPSGLSVELGVPREESASSLAQSDLEDSVVTLPAGMSIDTSAASGLGACPLLRGAEPEKEARERNREIAGINLESKEPANCPNSSKIASVEVTTPLLETPLHGSLYLAQQGNAGPAQGENPFSSLLAMYLVAEGSGVVLKIPGEVHLDPTTGQITAHFGEDPLTPQLHGLPQLPFSNLKIDFFGDSYAPLSTPTQCGGYTVTSQLTPWSAPQSGPPATPSSSFEVDQNCHGPVFSPSFTAGMVNNRAGAFSPFEVTFRREDGEGELGRLQVQMPPGLVGSIASAPECPEPQAAQGDCPESSLIGHVTAGVGAGPSQFYVPGKVYLTGPYNGAPFGLTIEVPAIAGPFNLDEDGRPVVDRAAIDIDPRTSVVTVTSAPLPQIIQGIPLQIRTVNVSIDRPGFTLNPTNCAPLRIGGTLTSTEGQSATVSDPFQSADCASLAFKPKVVVTVSGKTSKARGASLDYKLTYPPGSLGSAANVAKTKVELPKALPSRLTTLQKACTAAQFELNPAGCPPASVIGRVRANTPILPGELEGPVYFVSYGGAKFPELVIVLQGDGVRVDLHGETFISKAGITSSTFTAIPDVPVSTFELYLPEGPYSALAANGNLCTQSLVIPNSLTAQNGVVLKQNTKIAVTGCPKTKKKNAKASRARKSSDNRGAKS